MPAPLLLTAPLLLLLLASVSCLAPNILLDTGTSKLPIYKTVTDSLAGSLLHLDLHQLGLLPVVFLTVLNLLLIYVVMGSRGSRSSSSSRGSRGRRGGRRHLSSEQEVGPACDFLMRSLERGVEPSVEQEIR